MTGFDCIYLLFVDEIFAFWDFKQRKLIVCCGSFGTTCQSNLQGSSSPNYTVQIQSVPRSKLTPSLFDKTALTCCIGK
jgi:hypothetical protein